MSPTSDGPIPPRFARLLAGSLLALLLLFHLGTGAERALLSDAEGLATSVPDDAFYCLLPAFNYFQLGCFSFDRIHLASGFQPLWGILLAFLGAVFQERESFLRGAIFLVFLLRAIAALFLFVAARRIASRHSPEGGLVAGLAAAHLFLFHATVAFTQHSLLESALASMLLALLLAFSPAFGANGGGEDDRPFAYGTLLGAFVLARILPSTLLVAALLGWFRVRPRPRGWKPLVAGFALPVGGWIVYSFLAFGHLLPASAAVKLRGIAIGWNEGRLSEVAATGIRLVPAYLLNGLAFSAGLPSRFWDGWESPRLATLAVAIPLLLLWGFAIVRRRRGGGVPSAISSIGRLVAATLVGMAVTAFLLGTRGDELFYANWYLNELPILLALLVAVPFALAESAWPRIRRAALVGCVLLPLLALPTLRGLAPREPLPDDPWDFQNRVVVACRIARDGMKVGSETRIAAYDSGLLGWLLPAKVVNLDGLANDDVVEFWQEGSARFEYPRRNRIEYLFGPMKAPWYDNAWERHRVVATLPLRSLEPPLYLVSRFTDDPFPEVSDVRVGRYPARLEMPVAVEHAVFGFRDRVIFMHPPFGGTTEISFSLGGSIDRVEFLAGIWSRREETIPPGRGSVGFRVLVDGEEVVRRTIRANGNRPESFALPLADRRILRFVVDDGGDGADWDWFHVAGICFAESRQPDWGPVELKVVGR